MQGKERNSIRIDQQFKDHSWLEMSKILDEEMPQIPAKGNGKKRYLLLLMILFIGFASGIGTMVYINQNQKIEIPVLNDTTKDLAETTNILDNQLSPDQAKTASSISTPSEELRDQNIIKNNGDSKVQTKNIYTSKQNGGVDSFDPIAFENTDQNSIVLETNQTRQLSQVENRNINPIIKNTPTFDFISTKSDPLINAENDKKLNLLAISKDKKWKFGISLGAFSNNIKTFAGISFGGKVKYNLDRRFAVGTGLQYSILSGYKESSYSRTNEQSSLAVTNAVDSSSFEMLDEIYGPYRSIESSSGHDNLPISSLHYVEIPIELSYKISEKFQVQLGVKPGYLVKANADSPSVPDTNTLPSYSTQDRNLSDNKLYQSLNKINLATSIGIGFYPTKNFGIDLQYNHGLVDITKDNVWLQQQINTNNNFQLSATYFFGK